MRTYRALRDLAKNLRTLGLLGTYQAVMMGVKIRKLGKKAKGQLSEFLRYRNERKEKKEYPMVAYDENEVDEEAKALTDDEPLPDCCYETKTCGGNGLLKDGWALHLRNFRGANGMKYELMVEYPRALHPKLDAEIVSLAGKQPYDQALSPRMRTMEFAYEDHKSYEKAYLALSRRENVKVIGGNPDKETWGRR